MRTDTRKMAFSTTINFMSNAKNGQHGFTNNKVLLSHFELPKFNIALATHVYDMQLRSGHVTLLQTKFQPLNCPQLDLRHWAALCWALSHISSLFLNYLLVGL